MIGEVKGHVRAMQELIAASKQRELKESTEGALHAAMHRVIEQPHAPQGDQMCMFGDLGPQVALCAAPAAAAPAPAGGGMRLFGFGGGPRERTH